MLALPWCFLHSAKCLETTYPACVLVLRVEPLGHPRPHRPPTVISAICLFFYRNVPLVHQCNSYVRCRQWTLCSHLINPDPSVVQTALYSSLSFLSAVPKASTDSRSLMLSSSSQRQLKLSENAFCSALLPLKLQLLKFPRPRTDSTSVRRGISILRCLAHCLCLFIPSCSGDGARISVINDSVLFPESPWAALPLPFLHSPVRHSCE